MTFWRSCAAVFFVLGLLAAVPAASATYTYVGNAPGSSVVWISQPATAPMPEGSLRQTMKAFVPNVLVVTVGTSVRFPNDDTFYHSVYSESTSDSFDLGLYDSGPGKSVLFDQPGIVDIRCHVHGSMHATIVVVDGPFAQTANAPDRYRIDGVTRGAHDLHVWSGGDTVTTTKIIVK